MRCRRATARLSGASLMLTALVLPCASSVAGVVGATAGIASGGVASSVPAQSNDPFDAAVDLTRDGRFEDALDAFNAVQASGDDSARLHYNLGVVHYRLGQLGAARDAFLRAARDPETADMAHYNLGLVAMAANDPETASRWFREVQTGATSPELRGLAGTALARLMAQSRPRRGGITLTRGSDSDVILPAGTLADVPSSVHDGYWEIVATWADRPIEDSPDLGYHVGAVADRYDTVEDADLGVIEAGVDWRGPITLDFTASLTTVSDSPYQQSLELRSLIPFFARDNVLLSLELDAAGISAVSDTAVGLEGTQTSAGTIADASALGGRWSLSYRHLWNDREARSLSPQQDAVGLRVRWPLAAWSVRAWARWVGSDYRTGRNDDATDVGLGLGWSPSSRWDLLADVSRQENDSSMSAFSYRSTRISGGVRVRF